MSSPAPSRRAFLAAGAALALTARSAVGASDTLRVACIGTGGRCRRLMQSLNQIPGVKIVAVCDVNDGPLALARPLADAQAAASKEYRAVLDRKDVDAVVIGSPDHWHVPMTVDACAAGKDVYVEKPLTHAIEEGQSVIDAQNRHRRIVQVGTQQRSMPHLIKAREVLRAGKIGKVVKVHMSWNRNTDRVRKDAPPIDPKTVDWKAFLGNAPGQPFDAYRLRNWRWFWDFGGGLFTDLMVHWLDVAHWFLDLGHPERAVALGMHTVSKGIWQTPDTVQCVLHYPQGLQLHFEGTFANARLGAMCEFMGTDATLYVDRGRYELHPERNKKVPAEEMILGTGNRGQDFYDKPDGELLHVTEWVECVRSRKTPSCPAEAGVGAAAAAHLANQALRSGQTAVWKG
jgi:predicted dehydrogenase